MAQSDTVTFGEFQEHILELAQEFQQVESDQEAVEIAHHIATDLAYFLIQVEELYDALESDEGMGLPHDRIQA